MASSVLRQYTPPTCTLEISAKESPLSRWTNRSVLKHVRFQLSFDDPRLPPEQQVRVRGDRAQLEALHDAVSNYVQTMLSSAPAQLSTALSPRSPVIKSDRELSPANSPALPENGVGDRALTNSPNTFIQNGTLIEPQTTDGQRTGRSFGIYLEPKGLLTHDLHLGALESDDSHSTIHLSTLQLFDLANALDDYATESLALPSLGRASWAQSRAGWMRIAAVAVLAIGATTAVSKFVMDVSSPTVQTASSETTTAGKLPDATQPTGIAPAPGETGTADPFSTNLAPLPPPPPPGAIPQQSPRAGGLPPVTVPRTATPNPAAPPVRTTIPPLPQLAPVPQRVPANPDAIASAPRAPQQLQIPTESQGARAPELATQPSAESDSNLSANGRFAPSGQAGGAAREDGSGSAAPGTAFDTIPQVAEVRTYFQDRWQPPESLTEPLQYQLVLNPDGTLQQINPRGQAAGNYVDRTGMPLIGDPFVAPIESGQTARIHLVLNPNGRVQTFLEGME